MKSAEQLVPDLRTIREETIQGSKDYHAQSLLPRANKRKEPVTREPATSGINWHLPIFVNKAFKILKR